MYFGGVNTAGETLPGTSECSLLTVAAETDGPLLAVASYMWAKGFC